MSADPHDFFATAPVRSPETPPLQPVPPPSAQAKSSPRAVVVLGLVVLLVAVAAVGVNAMRHGGASGLGVDGPTATSQAFGGAPPATFTAHPQRLAPAVNPPAGSGGYVFEAGARFDPCRPIRYVVSGTEPFTGANAMLTQALQEAAAASGLQIVSAGTTAEPALPDRASYQPDRYGRTWAPILVAWTNEAAVPRLAGNVIGLGGPATASVHGQQRLVSGVLYFDAPELSLIALRPSGFAQMRTVMLHEIGHLLGLGHVQDPSAVMFPSDDAQGDYNAGDLRGLAYAGAGPCSKWS